MLSRFFCQQYNHDGATRLPQSIKVYPMSGLIFSKFLRYKQIPNLKQNLSSCAAECLDHTPAKGKTQFDNFADRHAAGP